MPSQDLSLSRVLRAQTPRSSNRPSQQQQEQDQSLGILRGLLGEQNPNPQYLQGAIANALGRVNDPNLQGQLLAFANSPQIQAQSPAIPQLQSGRRGGRGMIVPQQQQSASDFNQQQQTQTNVANERAALSNNLNRFQQNQQAQQESDAQSAQTLQDQRRLNLGNELGIPITQNKTFQSNGQTLGYKQLDPNAPDWNTMSNQVLDLPAQRKAELIRQNLWSTGDPAEDTKLLKGMSDARDKAEIARYHSADERISKGEIFVKRDPTGKVVSIMKRVPNPEAGVTNPLAPSHIEQPVHLEEMQDIVNGQKAGIVRKFATDYAEAGIDPSMLAVTKNVPAIAGAIGNPNANVPSALANGEKPMHPDVQARLAASLANQKENFPMASANPVIANVSGAIRDPNLMSGPVNMLENVFRGVNNATAKTSDFLMNIGAGITGSGNTYRSPTQDILPVFSENIPVNPLTRPNPAFEGYNDVLKNPMPPEFWKAIRQGQTGGGDF